VPDGCRAAAAVAGRAIEPVELLLHRRFDALECPFERLYVNGGAVVVGDVRRGRGEIVEDGVARARPSVVDQVQRLGRGMGAHQRGHARHPGAAEEVEDQVV